PRQLARAPRSPHRHSSQVVTLTRSQLYLGSSRCARPLPGAALPAMSLIPFAPLYLGSSRCARPLPRRGVTGHVAHPFRSIVSRSLPTLAHCFPRSFYLLCRSSLSLHSRKIGGGVNLRYELEI